MHNSQITLQGIAFFIVLALVLCADGLMDTLGPWGFAKYAGGAVALASGLVWLSNHLPKKKAVPRAATPRNGRTSRNG